MAEESQLFRKSRHPFPEAETLQLAWQVAKMVGPKKAALAGAEAPPGWNQEQKASEVVGLRSCELKLERRTDRDIVEERERERGML